VTIIDTDKITGRYLQELGLIQEAAEQRAEEWTAARMATIHWASVDYTREQRVVFNVALDLLEDDAWTDRERGLLDGVIRQAPAWTTDVNTADVIATARAVHREIKGWETAPTLSTEAA
jgi:hypothetical protein